MVLLVSVIEATSVRWAAWGAVGCKMQKIIIESSREVKPRDLKRSTVSANNHQLNIDDAIINHTESTKECNKN